MKKKKSNVIKANVKRRDTIRLSEERLQKLYNDVSEIVMSARIVIAKLEPKGDQLDRLLFKLQLAASDRAIKSVEEDL